MPPSRDDQNFRDHPNEGWDGYRRVVLHEIERLNREVKDMGDENRRDHAALVAELALVKTEMKTEIGALKVKAGFYGAVSGLASGIAVFIASIVGRGGLHG